MTKVRFDADKVPFRRLQSAVSTASKCRFDARESTARRLREYFSSPVKPALLNRSLKL